VSSEDAEQEIVELELDARFDLAEALQDRGHQARSRHILYQIARAPIRAEHRVRAWTLIAESWAADRDHVRAAGAYTRAARAGGRSVEAQNAQFALAMLRERHLRDVAGALAAYNALLEMAPDGPNAASARAAVRRIWDHCRSDASRCP
jgi:hypothetical protein